MPSNLEKYLNCYRTTTCMFQCTSWHYTFLCVKFAHWVLREHTADINNFVCQDILWHSNRQRMKSRLKHASVYLWFSLNLHRYRVSNEAKTTNMHMAFFTNAVVIYIFMHYSSWKDTLKVIFAFFFSIWFILNTLPYKSTQTIDWILLLYLTCNRVESRDRIQGSESQLIVSIVAIWGPIALFCSSSKGRLSDGRTVIH